MSELQRRYLTAKDFVVAQGYKSEIQWQADRSIQSVTESDLLREAAWVILCSGFREVTIRRLFTDISIAFCEWESASTIDQFKPFCIKSALQFFNHPGKLTAIANFATTLVREGFKKVLKEISANPVQRLSQFSYLGNVTAIHLAKNLGFCVAKPDRHLKRLAISAGSKGVDELCRDISEASGDPINVVDVVLWRYAALTYDFNLFRPTQRNRSLGRTARALAMR